MEKWKKYENPDVNPALQYRNYGKSLKRVLIPALQYRNFENAKKGDRQYRTFEASELKSNHSIAKNKDNEYKCTKYGVGLGRWFPEGFGQNPSRTEAKA